jgi:hypothetical protein
MKMAMGAMSLGDILDRGLRILLTRFPVFFMINLIVLMPIVVLQILLPKIMEENPTAAVGGLVLLLVLNMILSPIGSAAILRVISFEFLDRPIGIGPALSFGLSYFGRILGASILFGLGITVGFIMCLVPGILFLTWWALFAQVIVVENVGAMDSFSRSKQLTEGYRLRLLGLLLLSVLIEGLITYGLASVLEIVLPSQTSVVTDFLNQRVEVPVLANYTNYALHQVVLHLVTIVVNSFVTICLTLFYFDLRIRKEGFDLEMSLRPQATEME